MHRKKPLKRHKGLDQHHPWIPKKARQAGIVVFHGRPTKRQQHPKRTVRPPATAAEKAHIRRVARLGCLACRMEGRLSHANIHHMRTGYGASQRASHWEVLPLCEGHHQGNLAPPPGHPRKLAFHAAERTWQLKYGAEPYLLAKVWEQLGMDIATLPALRGEAPPWWESYLEGKFDHAPSEEVRNVLTLFDDDFDLDCILPDLED